MFEKCVFAANFYSYFSFFVFSLWFWTVIVMSIICVFFINWNNLFWHHGQTLILSICCSLSFVIFLFKLLIKDIWLDFKFYKLINLWIILFNFVSIEHWICLLVVFLFLFLVLDGTNLCSWMEMVKILIGI